MQYAHTTNKAIFNSIIFGILLGSSTVSAINDTAVIQNPNDNSTLRQTISEFDYYIGFDAKKRRMHYEKNLGSNIMPKVVPEYGVLLGVKFNNYFGLEFGYEWSKKVTANATGKEGDTLLNVGIEKDEEDRYSVTYKRTGYKLHAVFYTPYFVDNAKFKINAFATAGYVWQRVNMDGELNQKAFGSPLHAEPEKFKLSASKRTHATPELKIGVNLTAKARIHIRPYVGWSRTAKLPTFEDKVLEVTYGLKHKNSITYGINLCISL